MSKLSRSTKMRKHIRYRPPDDARAELDMRGIKGDFRGKIHALVFSEAHGGAGLICISNENIFVGSQVRVKVGQLAPMEAHVVWVREIDEGILKIGVQYLE